MLPLWKHQADAVEFIEGLGGCALLDHGMGSGKTRTAIEYAQRINARRVIVITPKAVIDHWEEDIAQFDSRTVRVANLGGGTALKKLKEITYATATAREPAYIVVNVESAVTKKLGPVLRNLGADLLIVDESHRMKSPKGSQSKWVGLMLAPGIPRRVLLTGTPMPHSPLDIWAQMRIVAPDVLGPSYWRFRNTYATMGGYEGKNVIGFQNVEELQGKVRPRVHHVKSEDVLDLPEALPPVKVAVTLDADERRAYKAVETEFEAQVLDGTITVSNALVKLLRLQQLTGGHAHIDTDDGRVCRATGNSKTAALFDMLDEDVPKHTPVVVFFRFVDEIDAVHEYALDAGYDPRILRGGVNQLAEWKSGEGDLLLTQIQCGGTGVDLSRSHVCVFYSLGYSLGEYLQACKRLHRPGQTHSVSYYHVVARNTVDGEVHRALKSREKIIDSVLAAIRRS